MYEAADFYDIDDLLTPEERAVRDRARAWVEAQLARMLTDITKAQLLALRLGRLRDAGKATPARVSMAKRANVETALEVARTTRELLDGVGILERHQCFRHMCNLESVKTYEGTQDMHTLILGREITGLSALTG